MTHDALLTAGELVVDDEPESEICRREKEYFDTVGAKRLALARKTWYGNPVYAARKCQSLLNDDPDPNADTRNDQVEYFMFFRCLILHFSSQSSRDLYTYLLAWNNTDSTEIGPAQRPAGNTLLDNNVTMEATWVEADYKNVSKLHRQWERIVDNATISLPHPQVWDAFRSPSCGILQPENLEGTGCIVMRASVSSPTLNVLCVNMERDPIVYEAWPYSKERNISDWYNEAGKGWLNRTVVDDVLRWGDNYQRDRPFFEAYPKGYSFQFPDPDGTGQVTVHCVVGFLRIAQLASILPARHNQDCTPAVEIKVTYTATDVTSGKRCLCSALIHWWGGLSNNPSIMTRLVAKTPRLPSDSPFMAEALCVFTLASLSSSASGTTFRHTWDYGHIDPRAKDDMFRDFNRTETFQASISSQQYTSGHIGEWQKAFYAVLGFVFVTNLLCLAYYMFHLGLSEDPTDPQAQFALAINCPPSANMAGSCVGCLEKKHMDVPWRISSASNSSGYCFEDLSSDLHIPSEMMPAPQQRVFRNG
ncbi:hypothetical protein FZEAL_700 [Fusarium zealandicum]|uniref:Uncharacterized protein n=1 Tax=Fusarium zealandicum TaxID=1053134 RepID=A0A8H4XQ13_9HYPO|nr:hypothetical protein FZEAL_700 [Fusarium zealandicum]